MTPFTVTFYSYKGGVGRTLLAANVAVELSRRGKTLLWDLDIEAPGLQRIEGVAPGSPAQSGLFEWLIEWKDKRKLDDLTPRDTDKLIASIRASQGAANLHVLAAHGVDADVASLYQQIDWHRFFVREPERGIKLLKVLLEAFHRAGYQRVIIDSRTGITDIGGLLVALVPHVTVLMGNFGVQSTAGLTAIWKALQGAADPNKPLIERIVDAPLTRLLVASPIPTGDPTKAAELLARWAKDFGADIRPIEIPFDERLRYREELLALTNPDSPAAQAYKQLAIQLGAIESERAQDAEAQERALRERPDLLPRGSRSTTEQGNRFEDRVAHLLRLLGYRVEPEQMFDSNRIDLVARKRIDFEEVTYFVECKDHKGAVDKDVVDKLDGWLRRPDAQAAHARGMIVGNSFAPAALQTARDTNIRALTPQDIERELIDFAPYLAHLRLDYEQSELPRYYVDQHVQPEAAPSEPTPILPYALDWARGKARSRLWVLLGDYGTGKTAFTRRLAYEMAKACETDRDAPLPLLVNLRDFPNKTTLEDVLIAGWAARTQVKGIDPKILMHLLNRGRVVLLLDSFDESGIAQIGRSVVEQFRALVAPTGRAGETPGGNRILITCREQFFRDREDAQRAMAGRTDSLDSAPLVQATRGFDGTIDLLPKFSPDQVREYLHKRLGPPKGDEALKTIHSIYDLGKLADRPQLLEIILESLPRLVARGGAINTGALYLEFTNAWLEKFRPSEGQVSADDMRRTLEAMAHLLWSRAGNRIHYADLFDRIRTDAGLRMGHDAGRMDLELRTATFLSRTADGHYGFSHKSFLEFFLARHLLRAVEQDTLGVAIDTERLNPESIGFLADLCTDAQATSLRQGLRTLFNKPLTSQSAANLVILAHRLAWRSTTTAEERATSPNMMSPIDVGRAMQAYVPENAELPGCDLSELDLRGLWLEGARIGPTRFERTILSFANLRGVRIDGGSMRQALMYKADLRGANLSGMDAGFVVGTNMDLSDCNLRNSSWIGAYLRGARLNAANLSGTDLRAASLAGAQAVDAKIDGTRFEGAVAPRATALPDTLRTLPLETLVRTLGFGHGGPVMSAAFSGDGQRIVTASGDRTARVWDAASGRALITLEGHGGGVTSAAFSDDGKRIVTGSGDNTARVWDAVNGRALITLEGHGASVMSVAFSGDGKRIVTGSGDNTAQVWDAVNGRALINLDSHGDSVTSAAFSCDGQRILTGSRDKTARIWDAASGRALITFEGHGAWVTSAAFSGDGQRIVTASWDKTARVWDAASGRTLITLEGHSAWVRSAAFSGDGQRIVTGSYDYTARVWDAASGRVLIVLGGSGTSVTSAAFSGDGERIVICSGGHIARVWDAASGRALITLDGRCTSVTSTAFSGDGQRIVTCSGDNTARVWDTDSGRALISLEGHGSSVLSAAFSGDGQRIVTGSGDNTARVWDAVNGRTLITLEGHGARVSSVAFSGDGKRIVTGSVDNTARVWDAASGRALITLNGHNISVTSAMFSGDDQRVVTGSLDKTARVWDAASGRALLTLEGHGGWVNSATFSSDGQRVVTGSEDNTARVWDAGNGRALLTLEGHGASVSSAAFSSDGQRIITGSEDNTARIWDTTSGKLLMELISLPDGWFSLHYGKPGAPPRFRAAGSGLNVLRYRDHMETPEPAPWIPREWMAADLLAELGMDAPESAAPV